MTIAQPIDLTDSEDAAELDLTGGEVHFENVVHHYGKLYGGLSGITLTVRAGEKGRNCRQVRSRQVDARQASAPFLRYRVRCHLDRRTGHLAVVTGRP